MVFGKKLSGKRYWQPPPPISALAGVGLWWTPPISALAEKSATPVKIEKNTPVEIRWRKVILSHSGEIKVRSQFISKLVILHPDFSMNT